MPAYTHPAAPSIHDDRVVHIQGNDRRPAYGGQAQELCPRLIPLEMIRPGLLPRMKQGHGFSGQRILGADSAAFEFVAATAGKAEVLKSGLAALGLTVDDLAQDGREEENFHRIVYRPWGSFDSVDEGDGYKVKRISVKPGARLSKQMHHHRAEHWVVVRGTARVFRDDEIFDLHANESVFIPLGATHYLENPGDDPLDIIEVLDHREDPPTNAAWTTARSLSHLRVSPTGDHVIDCCRCSERGSPGQKKSFQSKGGQNLWKRGQKRDGLLK